MQSKLLCSDGTFLKLINNSWMPKRLHQEKDDSSPFTEIEILDILDKNSLREWWKI